jgi:hydrogenase maturation protease
VLEQNDVKTLVLGVGNLLLADEGVGIHVIQRLAEAYQLPEDVLILDGGTLGLDLLFYLEGVENLLLIDAVEAHKEPGTIIRLENDEVPAFFSVKLSPHQIGIPDMLFAAKLKDIHPPNLVLFGIQPELLDIGLELSDTIAPKVDILINSTIEQLEAWGHPIKAKERQAAKA